MAQPWRCHRAPHSHRGLSGGTVSVCPAPCPSVLPYFQVPSAQPKDGSGSGLCRDAAEPHRVPSPLLCPPPQPRGPGGCLGVLGPLRRRAGCAEASSGAAVSSLSGSDQSRWDPAVSTSMRNRLPEPGGRRGDGAERVRGGGRGDMGAAAHPPQTSGEPGRGGAAKRNGQIMGGTQAKAGLRCSRRKSAFK